MTDISNSAVGSTAYQLALHVDFPIFKKEVAAIVDELCEQYLNVDRLKVDGEFTNRLPEDFNLSVISTFGEEFQTRLDKYPDEAVAATEIVRIKAEIEQCVSDGLIADRHSLIDALKFELRDSAKEYASAPLFANREVLLIDYEDAKKITFMEFFAGNVDDIFTFRNTMEKYARAVCENILFKKLARIYEALADVLS